jgi:hypothetical protein
MASKALKQRKDRWLRVKALGSRFAGHYFWGADRASFVSIFAGF